MKKVTYQDIESAALRLKSVVKETSIDKSFSASKAIGTDVFFKFENEQRTGSFKIRGAYNKISSLNPDEKKRGVIASSAGNHAQGVAFSAQSAEVRSVIVMPETAPLIKVNATRDYGAEVVLKGEIYDHAFEHAQELAKKEGYVFVHPFEDPMVIAGQGTVGLEIHHRLPDLDSVVVPVGGGGLISGVALALKEKNPKIKVIGVQAEKVPSMFELFRAQATQAQAKQSQSKHSPVGDSSGASAAGMSTSTIADGIAVKKPSQVMFDDYLSKYVDEMVTVTDDEIAQAIFYLIERAKAVAEGAGAAGLAALLSSRYSLLPLLGKKTCVVISGGNIDLNLISKIIDQGLVKKGRLVEISVIGGDVPGLMSSITRVLAEEKANILQVYHDRADLSLQLREARIVFLLETTSHEHVERIKKSLSGVYGVRLV